MLAGKHIIHGLLPMEYHQGKEQITAIQVPKAITRMIARERKALNCLCFSRKTGSVSSLTDALPRATISACSFAVTVCKKA